MNIAKAMAQHAADDRRRQRQQSELDQNHSASTASQLSISVVKIQEGAGMM